MSEYKLYQGDCLEVMDKLIEEGVKVDMILTDPPYGTTACKWDSVIPFDKMWDCLNKLIKGMKKQQTELKEAIAEGGNDEVEEVSAQIDLFIATLSKEVKGKI